MRSPKEVLKEHFVGKVVVDLEGEYTDDPEEDYTMFVLLPSKIENLKVVSDDACFIFVADDGHEFVVYENETVHLEDDV